MSDSQFGDLPESARLSDAQYGQIYQRVQSRLVSARRRARVQSAALALSAVAAVVLAVISVEGDRLPLEAGNAKGLGAGGEARVGRPRIEMGCEAPGRHTCRLGETLVFAVRGVARPAVLMAYARRLDAPGDIRIWYFGGGGRASVALRSEASTQVVPMAVRVAAPHTPGDYEVTAWVAEQPGRRAAPGSAGVETWAPPHARRLRLTVTQ